MVVLATLVPACPERDDEMAEAPAGDDDPCAAREWSDYEVAVDEADLIDECDVFDNVATWEPSG